MSSHHLLLIFFHWSSIKEINEIMETHRNGTHRMAGFKATHASTGF
jgi:hypothetical protein